MQTQRQRREFFVLERDTPISDRHELTVKEALLNLQRRYEEQGRRINILYGIALPVPSVPERVLSLTFVIDGIKVDRQTVAINCNPSQELTDRVTLHHLSWAQRAYGVNVWYFPHVPVHDLAQYIGARPDEVNSAVREWLGSPTNGASRLEMRIDRMLSCGVPSASDTFNDLKTTARFLERWRERNMTPEGKDGEIHQLAGWLPRHGSRRR